MILNKYNIENNLNNDYNANPVCFVVLLGGQKEEVN